MIKSCDDQMYELHNKTITRPNKTTLGSFSTRHLNEQYMLNKEKKKIKSVIKRKKEKTEINYIYKELFPPKEREKSGFTICHKEINVEESKSIAIDEKSNEDTFFKRRTILIQANKRHYTRIKSQYSSMSTRDDSLKKSQSRVAIDTENHKEIRINAAKNGDELRRSYIAKLIFKKVWQPNEEKKDHNSIFIFDWDDTLLCSSYLAPNGDYDEKKIIEEDDWIKIKKLESRVIKVLKLAINKGRTFIITNAASGWVEYSAKRYYPNLMKILPYVNIVSARSEYGKLFPGDTRQWKILSFLQILNEIDINLVTNLICLGDSTIEIEAANILGLHLKQVYIKTVKFKSNPTVDELINQLKLVIEHFGKIYSSVKNMNVKVIQKAYCDS
jgi:hypothetical protein